MRTAGGATAALAVLLLMAGPLRAEDAPEGSSAETSAAPARPAESPIEALRQHAPEGWRRGVRMLRDRVAPRLESELNRAFERTPEAVRPLLSAWAERVNQPGGRRLWLTVAGVLCFALALWRILRGPGMRAIYQLEVLMVTFQQGTLGKFTPSLGLSSGSAAARHRPPLQPVVSLRCSLF